MQMFLPVALLVKIGLVILLWGRRCALPPIPPSAFLLFKTQRHTCIKLPYVYIYIHTSINRQKYKDIY